MEVMSTKCVSCRSEFLTDQGDRAFFEAMKVPLPTHCPECRMVRRQVWRNERALYKRMCALCGEETITMYAPEKPFVVYCTDCYQSDKWDPMTYGRAFDFSKPFFEQFSALMQVVPRRALYQDFAEGSDYSNWAVYLKNSYLIFGGHHYEDTAYAAQSFYLKDCIDVDFSKKCEQCYGSIHLRQCNQVRFSAFSEDCADSWFLYGCRNCTNCVGCTNLRNASYCIYNQQYSREEYKKKLTEMALDTYEGASRVGVEALKRSLLYPHKYAWTKNVTNSSGDDLDQVRNCKHCFSASDSENCRYSFFIPGGAKDSYDLDHCGLGLELTYELMSGFGNNRVRFGNRVYYSHDVDYSDDCFNSASLFGCIGLRKKEHCVLNKQYSKEEYEELVGKIIKQMGDIPYRDRSGRDYSFGEFFPPELSPFAYNETVAQEYFPLTEETAGVVGFAWRENDKKEYKADVRSENLPRAKDAPSDLTEKIVTCSHSGSCNEQCTKAFRITKNELQFYQKLGVPLPRLCPNCRHYERLNQRNPLKLWKGRCCCSGAESVNGIYKNATFHIHGSERCLNEFETSYAPDRQEIIYCETCYQAEVV